MNDPISTHINSTEHLRNATISDPNGANNAGRAETIFFLAVIMLTFGFVCFSSPPFRRRANRDLSSPTPRTRTNLDDQNSRIEFVVAELPYRTVESGDSEGDDDDSSYSSDESLKDATANATKSGSDGKITSRSSETLLSSMVSCEGLCRLKDCSICLCSYSKGDVIAWSTNPTCQHEYHRDCIQHWLLSHEECPMCRNVFLLCKPETSTALSDSAPDESEEPQNDSQIQLETAITIHNEL